MKGGRRLGRSRGEFSRGFYAPVRDFHFFWLKLLVRVRDAKYWKLAVLHCPLLLRCCRRNDELCIRQTRAAPLIEELNARTSPRQLLLFEGELMKI